MFVSLVVATVCGDGVVVTDWELPFVLRGLLHFAQLNIFCGGLESPVDPKSIRGTQKGTGGWEMGPLENPD